ncbi:hypothetical protein Patl1_19505 [Pistacia atlantica]|uniref:Uncharacterized protein n=1 Tax=Pistacia atlantica TaxID=434234 RepID=A0ACC1C288_9ROSI|nr:hypothetical protein Patl1_19505 [Pistacia atlantica]
MATTSHVSFPIEKRRKSKILQERKSKAGLVKREPPNFEVGWRRTKEINLEKPIGYDIMGLWLHSTCSESRRESGKESERRAAAEWAFGLPRTERGRDSQNILGPMKFLGLRDGSGMEVVMALPQLASFN